MEKFLILLCLLCLSMIAIAQPPGPPATPIDGGLGLLLAGGLLYGLKALKQPKRKGS